MDRQSLLAALEGKLDSVHEAVEPVWCLKLPIPSGDPLSILTVEGVGTLLQVPLPTSVSLILLSIKGYVNYGLTPF